MFGFLLSSFLCLVLYIAIVFTGAVNYLTGALAERWTKQEFAVLGSEWHIFSNVAHSGEFGQAFRGFRTPRGAVGGREATDVCVSR